MLPGLKDWVGALIETVEFGILSSGLDLKQSFGNEDAD